MPYNALILLSKTKKHILTPHFISTLTKLIKQLTDMFYKCKHFFNFFCIFFILSINEDGELVGVLLIFPLFCLRFTISILKR